MHLSLVKTFAHIRNHTAPFNMFYLIVISVKLEQPTAQWESTAFLFLLLLFLGLPIGHWGGGIQEWTAAVHFKETWDVYMSAKMGYPPHELAPVIFRSNSNSFKVVSLSCSVCGRLPLTPLMLSEEHNKTSDIWNVQIFILLQLHIQNTNAR